MKKKLTLYCFYSFYATFIFLYESYFKHAHFLKIINVQDHREILTINLIYSHEINAIMFDLSVASIALIHIHLFLSYVNVNRIFLFWAERPRECLVLYKILNFFGPVFFGLMDYKEGSR